MGCTPEIVMNEVGVEPDLSIKQPLRMPWEKETATHSSVLAWRIPGMGEPGGFPCMGLHRVRHDCSNLAAATVAAAAGCSEHELGVNNCCTE